MVRSLINELRERTALMDVAEVADLLKVKKSTVYNYVETKMLSAIRVGDLLRFDPAELAETLEKLTTSQEQPDEVN